MTLLSCADRLATRGRNAERGDRRAPRAGRGADGGGARLARAAARPRRRCAATSWPRSSGIEPGPELGRLLARAGGGRLRRRGDRPRSRRSISPGRCARIPSDDRRPRRLPAGQRRDGRCDLSTPRGARPGGFVWIGLYEPTAGGVRLAAGASSSCTSSPSRTRSRRTSGRSSRSTSDMVFIVLKTARYVDSEEVVEFGELLVFLGRRLHHHRAPRRGQLAAGAREAPRGATPSSCARAPGAVLHAILDRVVDDYARRSKASRTTSTRSRSELFSDEPRPTLRERIYQPQARGARVPPRDGAAGRSGRPPGRAGTTSMIHPEIRDVLPRRQRPPDPRPRPARRAARSAARARFRPTSPRSACARTRTCARSRPGSRSSLCRPRSPASTA